MRIKEDVKRDIVCSMIEETLTDVKTSKYLTNKLFDNLNITVKVNSYYYTEELKKGE